MSWTESTVQYFEHAEPDILKQAYVLLEPEAGSDKAVKSPIVLVQGWTGVKEDWLQLAELLAVHHPVLMFDNRGMGQTDRGTIFPYTMPLLAADAVSLARHVFGGTRRCHFVGISMGGMIVETIALLYPAVVLSLTVGCSHMGCRTEIRGRPEDGLMHVLKAQSSGSTEDMDKRALVEKMMRMQFTEEWIRQNVVAYEASIDHSLQYKRSMKGAMLQFAAIASFERKSEIEERQALTKLVQAGMPMLIIHGDEDRVIAAANGWALHKVRRLIPVL